MGAAAAEADRTLFVGNLETKVTEELLFELFHQAGPVIKVKIPTDKDGKPKQFAFVNFKHEVSVPYAMNLLNGIKLFGRPIKIQFRSGSSHASQDVSVSYPPHPVGNSSPTSTSPGSRYERILDNVNASTQIIQRSFSSPENYQRQAVMNNVLRQMPYGGKFGSPHVDQSGFSPSVQSHNHPYSQSSSSQWRQDTPLPPRKVRQNSHPYLADRHYGREPRLSDPMSERHYRGGREDSSEDRNHDGWSADYDRRDGRREGRWRTARH
ncbi:RNA-binding protein 7 isoform X1 [Ochotona curzoniae]|uniref:RNA-binding protein 7 isoform X1 n=1 Tax=Ochotona curzoniae TaxID=130825 RepID=UPI001B34C06B|nr:RNA-binding protein 7 isoform X1 [Ochotona curzoniae]